MACEACGYKKAKTKILNNYRFDLSGLDNVYLSGVAVTECPKCDEIYYNYGSLQKIHSLIVKAIIDFSPKITGKELVFIRKHLGLDAKEFAKWLKVTHFTLSKYENGRMAIPKQTDTLVRYIAKDSLPNRNYNLHDKIEHISEENWPKNIKIDIKSKEPRVTNLAV